MVYVGGAYDRSHNGGVYDAFVTKIHPAGSQLTYSTFLGGSGDENGNPDTDLAVDAGIAVDQFGAAYVTGSTDS